MIFSLIIIQYDHSHR